MARPRDSKTMKTIGQSAKALGGSTRGRLSMCSFFTRRATPASGRAAEALAWTKAVMTKLGLTINEAKTSLRNARQERFDFLGYSFGAHWFEANGKWYLGASPSKKSVQRLKTRVGDLLVPSNIDPWPEVRDKLNRSLRGWSKYFGYG